MNLRQKRLSESIRELASEAIQTRTQLSEHQFGIISTLSVEITEDYQFADIYVHSEHDEQDLPHFLSPMAGQIQKQVGKLYTLKKVPRIRFRRVKEHSKETDILTLINLLDQQYGLSRENS